MSTLRTIALVWAVAALVFVILWANLWRFYAWHARYRRWMLRRMTRNICRKEAEADTRRATGITRCDEQTAQHWSGGPDFSVCSLNCGGGPCKFATLERESYERKLRERGLA